MTKEDVLKNCTVEGNIVKLPPEQLDRKLYQEVAKALELIGGKWKGGKVFGFVFQSDPTDLLNQIATGEKRNLKKEFQFFATPDSIADYLVKLSDIKDGDAILEPSAGQGAIIEAIYRKNKNVTVFAVELMDVNSMILTKKGFAHEKNDYLQAKTYFLYNKIIANPPFSMNQDIDHITKMYCDCKPGGRIVTIASKHWQLSNNKKETTFRNWLKEIDAEIIEIGKGSFKESGTMISSCIIVIDKKP
jgi:hypothetical protein